MSRKPDIAVSSPFMGKRKKNRCKTASASNNMQNWIDSTQISNYDNYNGLIPNNQAFCSPMIQSQRLYPAASDPSVCNNAFIGMPVHCRVEPTISLPLYSNHPPVMYQNWQTSASSAHTFNNRSPTKITTSTDSVYSSTKNNSDSQNQEFISLPVIDQLIIDDSGNKRRYSDPGLGPGLSNKSESSDCSSILTEDQKDNKLLYYLTEQMKHLMENNRKLSKELQDTKSELSALKQKMSNNYEPGCITDIVKEIKEAAKVREDALITKVRHMIGQNNLEQSYSSLLYNSSREVEDLRGQLNETRDLLSKKDEEIRNLKINSARMRGEPDPNRTHSLDDIHLAPKTQIWGFFSNLLSKSKPKDLDWGVLVEEGEIENDVGENNADSQATALMDKKFCHSRESLPTTYSDFVNSTVVNQLEPDLTSLRDVPITRTQVIELEQENLQIRRDLQNAVDSRKEVEAKNLSYERQFHLQQRKKTPTETIIIKTHGSQAHNSTNPFENNTFVSDDRPAKHEHTAPVNPFESQPLQVTLSGPVTDL